MAIVLLMLTVVSIVCALYITWKAYQDSVKWGLFFFFTPVIYYLLADITGALVAGLIVVGLQLMYVSRNWATVGNAFLVLVASWAATMLLPLAFGG